MSDSESALKRSLERQKQARIAAETMLQDRSRQLYEANEAMQKQVNIATSQQKQVQFLKDLAAEIWAASSVNDIVSIYLTATKEFLDHATPFYLQLSQQSNQPTNFILESLNRVGEIQIDDNPTTHDEMVVQAKVVDFKELTAVFEHIDYVKVCSIIDENSGRSQLFQLTSIYKSNGSNTLNEQFKNLIIENVHLYFVPIFTLNRKRGFACYLYIEGDSISQSKLATVEASRTSIALAIQRQMDSANLARKLEDLKKTNQKLEQAKLQLAQSERMAAIGQLAAGVAHEINNPIGFILSNYDSLAEYAEVLLKLIKLSKQLPNEQTAENIVNFLKEEDIDFIEEDLLNLLAASKNGLIRVQEIVAGLKSFSHNSDSEHQAFDLQSCIEDAIQLAWNELKYEHSVSKELLENVTVMGNKGQIQQVLVNMFVNAKQAMPNGGNLDITMSLEPELPLPIKIKVTDQGLGIKPEHLEKLFTPFFTTKAVGVGTGLGLSISYGIIADHGGDITVESEVGNGTCFTISLPAYSE